MVLDVVENESIQVFLGCSPIFARIPFRQEIEPSKFPSEMNKDMRYEIIEPQWLGMSGTQMWRSRNPRERVSSSLKTRFHVHDESCNKAVLCRRVIVSNDGGRRV